MYINRDSGIAYFVRLHTILVLVIHGLVVVSCAPQPVDCSRVDAFCVGVVTAYEGIEDHGLNQDTWEALQSIESQVQIARLDLIESVDSRDWQKNIVFFADNHYDVIVTVGASLDEAMKAVTLQYPTLSFIGIDQTFDEYNENVASLGFPEDQAGFLAGMLAAMISTSGKVGAICETSGIDEVWQYCEGFRAGALHEMSDIEVTVVYRDSGDRDKLFNDPEWGSQAMLGLIEKGVDTMSGFGGITAQGAFLTASERGILVIGTEGDLYYRLPDLQPMLVTSIINDPGAGLSSLVLLASQGSPISGSHAGQINYTPFRMSQFAIDTDLKTNLENALQGIRTGEIEINLPPKKE